MIDDLQTSASEAVKGQVPWSDKASWWIVLIQGLVALGIGLYILIAGESASRTTIDILAVLLLVSGVVDTYLGVRGELRPNTVVYSMLGAGVSLAVGAIILADFFNNFMPTRNAAIILGIGLLFLGVTNLFGWVLGGEKGGRSIMSLGMAIGSLVLGFMAVWASDAAATTLRYLGWAAVAVGVLLAGWSLLLRSRRDNVATTVTKP